MCPPPTVCSRPCRWSRVGLALAPCLLVLLATVCVYSMQLLLQCKHALSRRGSTARTFGDIGEEVWGARGRRLIDFNVCVVQLGVCVSAVAVLHPRKKGYVRI